MGKFYTVDRLRGLSEGLTVTLKQFNDITPPELQKHVEDQFPAGVSRHGDKYFLHNGSHGAVASPAIELLFEYVRRAAFPDRPSRFSSIFAVESLGNAELFRARFGDEEAPIYEIEGSPSHFRANMVMLTLENSALVCSHLAHEYWRGNVGLQNTTPFWEILLGLPVTIGARVR